jgi:hypothetical protein
MYVRFVTPLIDADTRVETGIFQSRRQYLGARQPDWLLDAFQVEVDWFNECLDEPVRLGLQFRRGRSVWGVCWFRAEATEAIRRAQNYARLLQSVGVPVRRISWRGPAQVIWSDEQQIVAAPSRAMPRAFH